MDSPFSNGNEAFEKEFQEEFHGVSYIVVLTVKNGHFLVEVEMSDTNDRWSGDFSSTFIEEITQRAGSFKKFGTFVKMVVSAFSHESESVFVDLLTYSDLEMLKARKLGAVNNGKSDESSQISSSSSAASSSNKASSLKRYIILTYSGEFDKVHYPLPLSFEDTPNSDSLQRTIRRLRDRLNDKFDISVQPANEREKELRVIVAQLSKENAEFRHRCRQLESRLTKLSNSKEASSGSAGSSTNSNNNIDKWKKLVDQLKKELQDSTNAFEKYRIESRREIQKWKQRLSISGNENDRNSHGFSSPTSSTSSTSFLTTSTAMPSPTVQALRRRIQDLENELLLTRRNSSRSHQNTRPNSQTRGHSTTSSTGNTSRTRSRSQSPQQPLWENKRNSSSNSRPTRSSTPPRFDPTAYHQAQQQKWADIHEKRRRSVQSSQSSNFSQGSSSQDSHESSSRHSSRERSSERSRERTSADRRRKEGTTSTTTTTSSQHSNGGSSSHSHSHRVTPPRTGSTGKSSQDRNPTTKESNYRSRSASPPFLTKQDPSQSRPPSATRSHGFPGGSSTDHHASMSNSTSTRTSRDRGSRRGSSSSTTSPMVATAAAMESNNKTSKTVNARRSNNNNPSRSPLPTDNQKETMELRAQAIKKSSLTNNNSPRSYLGSRAAWEESPSSSSSSTRRSDQPTQPRSQQPSKKAGSWNSKGSLMNVVDNLHDDDENGNEYYYDDNPDPDDDDDDKDSIPMTGMEDQNPYSAKKAMLMMSPGTVLKNHQQQKSVIEAAHESPLASGSYNKNNKNSSSSSSSSPMASSASTRDKDGPTTAAATSTAAEGTESSFRSSDEMSDIDRRIRALQNYLDKAKSGILDGA